MWAWRCSQLEVGQDACGVVITATLGRDSLRRCAESIQRQDHARVRHLVVVDRAERAADVYGLLDGVGGAKELNILVLPKQTGHSEHFGYRIYGAMSLLMDEDVIFFLDDDNWFEPRHVASMIGTLSSTGASWAYSLRRIGSEDGELHL